MELLCYYEGDGRTVNVRNSGSLHLVVLVDRLGGLLFDGRRSCIDGSFVARSGLYRGESLMVSVLVCV